MEKAVQEIINRIINGERNLGKIKREIGKKYSLKNLPKNTEIIKRFPKGKLTKEILQLLKRKPMRTSSGVSPVAIMIRPEKSCPYKCIYCPYTGKAPKSYTGEEPAALRARESKFDPFVQVKTRLNQFRINGHPTDKCDVIIMGGTFLRTPEKYQRYFVKRIYDGMNGRNSKNLEEAKKLNEKAKNKVIGLTIETRPDVCGKKEIEKILEYGGTKVELGVQNPDDRIYRKIKRGHMIKEVVEATELLKNSGLKVCYHLMPGLPGSDKKKDIKMIEKIFQDERFKPDMLKIYPTLVIEGTGLYKLMEKGKYRALNTEEAVEIISEWYRKVPEYARIMRIQRDIPSNLIGEGVKKSNLRELVEWKLKEKGIKSKEIRSREIGLNKISITGNKKITIMNGVHGAHGTKFHREMKKTEYKASKGIELFISLVINNYLIGFIRMRIPGKGKKIRKEIDENSAVVRELHVYGEEVGVGKKGEVQHKGFGKSLLKEAENIAKNKFRKKKMIVMSGVGVKEYYRRLGYKKEGPYVSKKL